MQAPSLPATKIADDLVSKANGLRIFLKRQDTLHSAGHLTNVDINRIYAGAFIQYFTELERALERLFIGLLMERYYSSVPNFRVLVKIKSYAVAHKVIRGGSKYTDWLPYENTEKRAYAFFSGGRPFTILEHSDRESIQKTRFIRNAIAHQSSNAEKTFKKHCVEGLSLPISQHNPSGYLRGLHSPDVNRLNYLIASTVNTFKKLC